MHYAGIGHLTRQPPIPDGDIALLRNPFQRSWFRSFMKRHRDALRYSAPRPLEPARRDVSAKDLEEFYQKLGSVLVEKRIPPALMSNFDETMLKASNKTRKVVFRSHLAVPTVPTNDKVTHVTLGACVFADGDSILPLCILDRKFIPQELPDHVKAGFHWVHQSSGWITKESFHQWVSDVFIPYVEEKRFAKGLSGRYALLLVDGHSSRANPEMLDECRRAKIVVMSYVSHSSALCQVLDRGVFRAYKTELTKLKGTQSFRSQVAWRNETLGHSVRAMRIATSPGTILDAWKESGCWPVDKTKAINLSNFPGLDVDVQPSSPPPKRRRGGFRISNRILTSQAVIDELSEDKQ